MKQSLRALTVQTKSRYLLRCSTRTRHQRDPRLPLVFTGRSIKPRLHLRQSHFLLWRIFHRGHGQLFRLPTFAAPSIVLVTVMVYPKLSHVTDQPPGLSNQVPMAIPKASQVPGGVSLHTRVEAHSKTLISTCCRAQEGAFRHENQVDVRGSMLLLLHQHRLLLPMCRACDSLAHAKMAYN